jgi:hypothetical protein
MHWQVCGEALSLTHRRVFSPVTPLSAVQACSADVAKHCTHVVPGNGRVHACLRKNEGKLSQQCKQQVETAEAREHQEVSLNPIIRE